MSPTQGSFVCRFTNTLAWVGQRFLHAPEVFTADAKLLRGHHYSGRCRLAHSQTSINNVRHKQNLYQTKEICSWKSHQRERNLIA